MGKKRTRRKKRKPLKTFTFRGYTQDELVRMTAEDFYRICGARGRRRLRNGKAPNPSKFFRKIRTSKRNCEIGETPREVKTHLRDLIVCPELIGSVVGIHNGMHFVKVLVHENMLGHKLGEFSLTFKPIKHSRPGLRATRGSKYVPNK